MTAAMTTPDTTAFESIIDDIRERDRDVNAFVAYADESVSSNTGVPFQAKFPEDDRGYWTFAIKANIAVANLPFTAGIGGYRDRIATEDAPCVAKLRSAGGIIVGMVNMEEAALGAVTNNLHFGKTHNPHCHGYTPGGSSGGSGAAVAASLVRVALGTDTMGSCRIPAAYCGVVGFKPTFAAIAMTGVEPLAKRLDHVGILANTVSDVATVFAILADDVEEVSAATNLTVQRIAVLDDAARTGLSPEVLAAYDAALNKLCESGYTLVARSVDQSQLARARRAGLLVCEKELAHTLAPLLSQADVADSSISPHLQKLIAFGKTKSDADLAAAHAILDHMVAYFASQMEDVDVIAWPTAPQTAFSFDDAVPASQADYTCLANFVGAPAISLPLPAPVGTLPVGLQLMMRNDADTDLLRFAAQVEALLAS
jgi:aspartyl-tRNA(Asn)/glutamyl-tRNA(Gln) amidotransferase subunit A